MDKFFKPISHNELQFSTCNVLHGSCLDRLKEIPDGTIDAVVCDPPYHLQSIVQRFSSPDAAPAQSKESGVYARSSRGFMGQTWDGGDIAFRTDVWRECLRVLKAGGHLVAFGGTRTVHRIACAIEDSGFEIRDMISWLYFSGFPKSLDVSKGIDKLAGAEREIIGQKFVTNAAQGKGLGHGQLIGGKVKAGNIDITAPATPEAQHWAGYGTALKPSQEPAILARKPIEAGSIAKQVLATGTGAINIDGCRFAFGDSCWVGPNDETGRS
jgi:site-specific DNA-methyltransferase (adenine-specific)